MISIFTFCVKTSSAIMLVYFPTLPTMPRGSPAFDSKLQREHGILGNGVCCMSSSLRLPRYTAYLTLTDLLGSLSTQETFVKLKRFRIDGKCLSFVFLMLQKSLEKSLFNTWLVLFVLVRYSRHKESLAVSGSCCFCSFLMRETGC